MEFDNGITAREGESTAFPSRIHEYKEQVMISMVETVKTVNKILLGCSSRKLIVVVFFMLFFMLLGFGLGNKSSVKCVENANLKT